MKDRIQLDPKSLLLEFQGRDGPTRLIVPLILPVGKHRNVTIVISPRNGVALRNEVSLGDILQGSPFRSHTTSGGASFFATASHSRTFGINEKLYEVVYLSDFKSIRFTLYEYEVHNEPIGLLLSFPIINCNVETKESYFAEITLQQNNNVLDRFRIPREVHPCAGNVLFLSGYSEKFRGMFGFKNESQIAGMRRHFLNFSDITTCSIDNLKDVASKGYDGIHFHTSVGRNTISLNDVSVPSELFCREIDDLGLKFIFIDTCNSVVIVNLFRNTDIPVLIASTGSLYEEYADGFERIFYDELGKGEFISVAFEKATKLNGVGTTRSGSYDPMFLDLRSDFRFGEK